jgi:hypothetical protein
MSKDTAKPLYAFTVKGTREEVFEIMRELFATDASWDAFVYDVNTDTFVARVNKVEVRFSQVTK